MANQGLFDQVKDFLLGHPETAGTTATTAGPAPDAHTTPEALPQPVPEPGPDAGPTPGDA